MQTLSLHIADWNEAQIIEGCVAGNRNSQAMLYHHFSSKMMGVCMRYSNNYHTAEDILQEGFIKVFTYIEKYRGEGSFEGWIRRIFVNTAIEHFRKNSKMYATDDLQSVESSIINEDAVSNLSAKDLVSYIQQMSPGYRTIFNMYVVEGYSHKEIAQMLGISEGTSKSQLARARGLLQKLITDKNEIL